jgi:hypothetical protein
MPVKARLAFAAKVGAPRQEEQAMPKGEQRSNKMAKKPKKDTSPPKETHSDRPMPPTTTVLPTKGKPKKP